MENSLKVPLAETFRIDKCKGEVFVRNWKDCILIEIKLRKDFKWKRTKWLLKCWKDQKTNQKKIMFLEYLWQKQRKFHVDIIIRSVSEIGDQEGGFLGDILGSWSEIGGQGHP